MEFECALKTLKTTKSITRDNWPYFLLFDMEGYLILKDHRGVLTPYIISEYDFDYEWEIWEK